MKRASLKMAILIPSISILLIGIAAMVIVISSVASSSTNDLTRRLIDARVNEYSNKFESISLDAYSTARTIAPIIASRAQNSRSPREEILTLLESVLTSDENLLGIWTCWEPNALDNNDAAYVNAPNHDETGRFIPYVFRDGAGYGVEPLENYTTPGAGDYYLGAKSSGAPYITDPYTYEVAGRTIPVYTVAIPIKRDNVFVGAIGIDINLETLVNAMNAGSILDDGYLFVLSPTGLVSTHSDQSILLKDFGTTWLGKHSADVDKLLLSGTDISMETKTDTEAVRLLGNAVKVGNSQNYWGVFGIVPETNATAAANSITLLVVVIGVALIAVTGLAIFFLIRNGLSKMPVITEMAGRIAVGDVAALRFDTDTAPTKNEIVLLERAFKTIADSTAQQSDIMTKIASGDYSLDIPVRSDGDIMNNAINNMIEKTNDTLSRVNESAVQVSTGSHQVADGAQALAAGSTEQAASVQQLSSSIAEIAEHTKTNAAKANQAARLAEDIKKSAEKGSEQMDDMMKSVKDINEASQSISKVIKTIDDIAFQTNILALNAAVEAARAGQHGKGFAVVAEEVRNLSAKSAQAAKDTENLIADSMQKAAQGVHIATDTAASLSDIVSGINESGVLITEIARASEEQSTSIEQVNSGIDQVAKVVQMNSATAEESAAASQEMSSQAAVLRDLIAPFRLKNEGSSRRLNSGGAPRNARRISAPKDDYSDLQDEGDYGKY